MMEKLSVLIPTYNEEKNILDCIESVKWADEILIADSFSNDGTLEIARRYANVKIIQREYKYSASQKNWAIPQTLHKWVLILDADERLSEKLASEIKIVLKKEFAVGDACAYKICRDNYFLGKRIRYSGWQNDYVIRLFRREKAKYEDKYVHAKLIVDGKVKTLKHHITHFTYNSLDAYFKKMKKYTTWAAMDKFKKNKKSNCFIIWFRFNMKFIRDYFLRLGILDGSTGFILCLLSAFSDFLKYVKLWLLIRGKNI